jgi:hypothetical protein
MGARRLSKPHASGAVNLFSLAGLTLHQDGEYEGTCGQTRLEVLESCFVGLPVPVTVGTVIADHPRIDPCERDYPHTALTLDG